MSSLSEDKAPGPDRFPLKVFRTFWEVMGKDVSLVVHEFHEKAALCQSLNATFVSLIPKKKGASEMKDFKPISFLGSVYKIIAKLLAKRMKEIMGDIISPS